MKEEEASYAVVVERVQVVPDIFLSCSDLFV